MKTLETFPPVKWSHSKPKNNENTSGTSTKRPEIVVSKQYVCLDHISSIQNPIHTDNFKERPENSMSKSSCSVSIKS